MSESNQIADATTLSSDALFKPFPFGAKTLKNRIAMAPMTRSKSPGKVPGDDVSAYYRRRAEGGVGLIITEGVNPGHPSSSGFPDVPQLEGDAAVAGWKKVVDEVHAADGVIIPQIWHCGSIRQTGMEPNPTVPGFGPSAVKHPSFKEGEGEPPHEMTQQDVDDVIASFARSAANAKAAGFDGLEIHGAHSYLIDQFFWDATNKRTDKYGGNLCERTAFAVELIQAVRAAVGAEFPIVFRFSQWKQGAYRFKMAENPQELEQWLAKLCDAGVDIFHASTRRFNDPEFEGSNLNLAGWTKKLTGKPAITVGSVGLDNDFLKMYGGEDTGQAGIDALIQRMENDEFDLVAVGRALLSDPAWPKKVQEGRESEIVPFTRAALAELL